MTTLGATRIARIGLTTPDLAGACAFYETALGFRRVGSETRGGAGFAALTGIAGARADVAVLRLGGQEIELVAFDPPGRPYPTPRSAADPWFQHFAVVVADMAAAYAPLAAGTGAGAISIGGPVRLPPSTGEIEAYKFRDPDGRPLELSYFPAAVAAPEWRDPSAATVFQGVDHSAIAVADIDASVAFYTGALGMTLAGRQVNTGPTQDRLDGMAGVRVDILVLALPGGGPHLELLAYPGARRSAGPPRPNDAAATRLVLSVAGLSGCVERLQAAGAAFVSPGAVVLEGGAQGALVGDPDGHLIELRG